MTDPLPPVTDPPPPDSGPQPPPISEITSPPAITTTSLPGAEAGVSYSATLAYTGGLGPYTWSDNAGDLPAWLTLDGSAGTLSGTPAQAETDTITITLTDAYGYTSTAQLTVTVVGGPSITTTGTLPVANTGVSYSQNLAATGGTAPYTWAVTSGSLPAGMSLDPNLGVISGTGTTSATSAFTVTVTDANGQTATASLSIQVRKPSNKGG